MAATNESTTAGHSSPGGPVEVAGPDGAELEVPIPAGSRHDGVYARWGKRAFDLVVGTLALVVSLPLLGVAALVILVTSGRPILFRQVRLGRDGRPFEVLKFRTMKSDRRNARKAPSWDGVERRHTHKTPDHPLLTPVGRFMRRYSIDEMPQVLNVLRGEMSIVGPRPELPSVVSRYEPWQYARMLVRPGLTGLWQINARGSTPMHEAVEFDIEYLQTMSFGTDVRIIASTPSAMLGEHKGY